MFKSLKRAEEIWKFRLRLSRALRDSPSRTAASADELGHLVALQTATWQGRLFPSGPAAQQALRELSDRSISAFVFSVRRGRVRTWPKPAFSFPPDQEALGRLEQHSYERRAAIYQAFIAKVVRRCGFRHEIDFILDVCDQPVVTDKFPVFTFQKERGSNHLLMPDVDFFHSKWYRDDLDPLAYEDKALSACFVGASTGGWHSVESVRQHGSPRLRAAAYLQDDPRVFFRLAKAVQCRSDEARALLMSQPYFCPFVSWQDQLRHRFIISLDGNGAACSRLVKGLQSNSVVIKFDSAHELYYFPALKPGLDYVAVADERGLAPVLEAEVSAPGAFKAVAASGQRFFAKYLTVHSVVDYTARLLSAYAALTRP
jgi:hypothetical protein